MSVCIRTCIRVVVFFFQAEDGIRDHCVTGVQTCALPISCARRTNSRSSVAPAGLEARPGTSLTPGGKIGRASCRKECRSRWSPEPEKKKRPEKHGYAQRYDQVKDKCSKILQHQTHIAADA